MITVRFTQCCKELKLSGYMHELALMPVLPRLERYEQMLMELKWFGGDVTYTTHDEYFLLIAQYLRRKSILTGLTFVSVCGCANTLAWDRERRIVIDAEGDFTDDPHHGFFPQRLKYLR